jgi:hypothetical protein
MEPGSREQGASGTREAEGEEENGEAKSQEGEGPRKEGDQAQGEEALTQAGLKTRLYFRTSAGNQRRKTSARNRSV